MAAASEPESAPAGPREVDDITLRLAQRGEAKAQRRFVRTYEVPVFHLLSRLLAPSADRASVEDLAQETMQRALRALPGFDPQGPAKVSTWVLTIASRLALQRLRRRTSAVVPLAQPDARVSDVATPEQVLDADSMRERARAALACLSPEVRAAFVLSCAHGLSPAEVARVLDVAPATARTRIFRARAAMRTALGED